MSKSFLENNSGEKMHINNLANNCGYFDGETRINNGYGCNHPEQRLKEDGQGKCMPKSCPLAYWIEFNYVRVKKK